MIQGSFNVSRRGIRLVVLLGAMLPGFCRAAVPAGIPHSLAQERAARLSHLRYAIHFTLQAHATNIAGHEVLTFDNAAPGPLLLDFREGVVSAVTVNGHPVSARLQNGHIELPAAGLLMGSNTVGLDFVSPVAPAGKAITRFADGDDGSEYFYSLFVPMDASMAFPCFDQPDLKGRFRLEMTAPSAWTIIANTAVEHSTAGGGLAISSFAETRPISTYLFAFAAGPFVRVHSTPGLPDVYVRKSQAGRARDEVPAVQEITARGMQFLSQYFAQPFPFPKYDMVLIPGFPFGGMEHAGATFLREDAVLFRTAPTASDRFQREVLLLHELTHQWFGDLVTMRWFDDLWLKEGFAQYMAYRALDQLEPRQNVWKRFYEAIKPAAYGIDETQGTTPIFQNIVNLQDAKSAYGAIVYSKAPALLKQLVYRIGEDNFRDGLRLYLRQHEYGNAGWSDLTGALEEVSRQDLSGWAQAWIQRRGMPQVDVSWWCNDRHKIDRLRLSQHDVLGQGAVWPITNEMLLAYGANPVRIRVSWQSPEVQVKEAVGKPCPAYVFANGDDQAYGRFMLDPHSYSAVVRELKPGAAQRGVSGNAGPRASSDPLLRTMLWGALWESVHQAKSPPGEYIELALASLDDEADESLARSQGANLTTALHRYISQEARRAIVPRVEATVIGRMTHADETGLRIISFRTLTGVAESALGRRELKDILSNKVQVPGVTLRQLDRWNLVAKLISLNDAEAEQVFAMERQKDLSAEGEKYAYAAQAGHPSAATKQHYFDDYMNNPARPEDWIEQSLRPFNAWNQSPWTEPFLKPALDALPQMKRSRKIFFVMNWLTAFINGQSTVSAQEIVQAWLRQGSREADLRLKVLEVSDELDRTIIIRERYP